MLLALVLAASGLSFFSGQELSQQPKRALKLHLVEVDDELFVLKQSLSQTGAEVFLQATGSAAPYVALAGLPSLLIGLLVRGSSGTSGAGPVIETGVIVATVLLGAAVLSAFVYAIGRMIIHGFDVAEWSARETKLTAYRPQVVSALAAAP